MVNDFDGPLDLTTLRRRDDDRLAAIAADAAAERARKYEQAIRLCGELVADELDFGIAHARKSERFWDLIDSIDNDDQNAKRIRMESI